MVFVLYCFFFSVWQTVNAISLKTKNSQIETQHQTSRSEIENKLNWILFFLRRFRFVARFHRFCHWNLERNSVTVWQGARNWVYVGGEKKDRKREVQSTRYPSSVGCTHKAHHRTAHCSFSELRTMVYVRAQCSCSFQSMSEFVWCIHAKCKHSSYQTVEFTQTLTHTRESKQSRNRGIGTNYTTNKQQRPRAANNCCVIK